MLNHTTGLFVQTARLTASDALSGDSFGTRVALSGNTLIVASSTWYYGSTATGSLYVFERNNDTGVFIQVSKFTSPTGTGNNGFASQIAISKDRFISTTYDNLYIYERNIATNLFAEADHLSISGSYPGVALDGDRIVLGYPYKDVNTNYEAGVAYLYEPNPSTGLFGQAAKLTASDAASEDHFGSDIAISEDTITVTTRSNEGGGIYDHVYSNSAVYIFNYNNSTGNFEQTDKLTAPTAALTDDYLGTSVAINGNKLITGGQDEGNKGTAYIFERSSFAASFEQTIKLTDPYNTGYGFGYYVTISNDRAIVGGYSTYYIYGNRSGTYSVVPSIMLLLD